MIGFANIYKNIANITYDINDINDIISIGYQQTSKKWLAHWCLMFAGEAFQGSEGARCCSVHRLGGEDS